MKDVCLGQNNDKGQIGLEGHTEAILCQPVRIFLS